jgi:hypothetical protein
VSISLPFVIILLRGYSYTLSADPPFLVHLATNPYFYNGWKKQIMRVRAAAKNAGK